MKETKEKAGYSSVDVEQESNQSVLLLHGSFDRVLVQLFVWHTVVLSGLFQYNCCTFMHWKSHTPQTAVVLVSLILHSWYFRRCYQK